MSSIFSIWPSDSPPTDARGTKHAKVSVLGDRMVHTLLLLLDRGAWSCPADEIARRSAQNTLTLLRKPAEIPHHLAESGNYDAGVSWLRRPRCMTGSAQTTKELSVLQRKVLKAVEGKPTATVAELAEVVGGVSKGSILKKLASLRMKGAITDVLMVSPSFSQYWFRAFISIKVVPKELNSETYGYSDQPSFRQFLESGLRTCPQAKSIILDTKITSCHIVLGAESDMLLYVAATHPDRVRDFVTQVLRMLPGVQNTTTAMVF